MAGGALSICTAVTGVAPRGVANRRSSNRLGLRFETDGVPRSARQILGGASYRRTDTLRLWSIHPRHLDARGLVALWREGLLARAVLLGRTTGYRHHPQLQRFLHRRKPVRALDCYLSCVLDEARARGYRFDERKIRYRRCQHARAHLSRGQLHYEWQHLLKKVAKRDLSWRGVSHRAFLARTITHHGRACRIAPTPVSAPRCSPRIARVLAFPCAT